MSSRGVEGWTPFHSAPERGHLPIAKFLLEVDIRNGIGDTSLCHVYGSGELDVVRFLIEKGAYIHAKNSNGLNPLHDC